MINAGRKGRSRRPLVRTSDEMSAEPVMIDRELRWMLERDGYELHGIAERLIGQDYGYEMPGSDVKIALEIVDDNAFELIKDGSGPPVMSSATRIGTAYYHGHYLFVGQLLAQTLWAAVVGRKLGDVVSTGIRRLDDRPILEAVTCTERYWPPTAATRFIFAPDLVELGTRPA